MDSTLDLRGLKLGATAEVLHKPGAVKLDGFPLLVYAPEEHGSGIRTEDYGILVSDIAASIAVTPDCDVVAAKYRTTPEHVRQALAYAAAVGYLQP